MKKGWIDNIWIGIALGLLLPLVGMLAYYQINFSGMEFYLFIRHLKLGNTYTSFVTLSLVANLAVFFPFIQKEKYYAARGVLASTIFWAAVVIFLKYFTEG